MSCCKDGQAPPGRWQFLPDDRVPPSLSVVPASAPAPPDAQPGRAPSSGKSMPWWAWAVIALVLLSLMKRSSP